ncbi:MAG: CoA pyrophosphatase [Eubacterium sp.]|nr:CoA pyrophosphatase [Eubacterium sp.]
MHDWIKIIEESRKSGTAGPDEEKKRQEGFSVLIPLVEREDGETCILFEMRAFDLKAQPGEVCFPGGGMEEGETPLEAVLRETEEELRIGRDQIRILGEERPPEALIGIHVYAGVLENYTGTFSEDEVDHTFMIPLSWFLENPPKIYEAAVTTVPGEDFPFHLIPGGRNYPWRRRRTEICFYEHPDAVIWGLTARMLYLFCEKLRGYFRTGEEENT